MAKRTFNDADRFLIERWQEGKNLADSMKTVREKYRAALKKIGEEAIERHEKLDTFDEFFTQGWATGNLVFGRKAWLGVKNDDPNGLWFENLLLDYLTSEEEGIPGVYVWVKSARKAGVNIAAAKKKLQEILPTLIDSEEQTRSFEFDDKSDVLISWNFSSKQELVAWLLADEMEKLSECVHEQVEIFVKLLPVLDEILLLPQHSLDANKLPSA